ncbi:MAG: hypothetical protein WA117_16125 [Verrucomicrobiia bacterium]
MQQNDPHNTFNRRTFLTQSLAASAGIAAAAAASHQALAETRPAAKPSSQAPGQLPKGKIGDLEISRLILGTNHVTFFMHSRDLHYVNDLSRHYNTDEKIIETFAAAEASGVTAFMTHQDPKIAKLFRQYRDRGGKLKWIVAPWSDAEGRRVADPASYQRAVPQLVDSGVDALYVPGMITGTLVKQGKGALIGEMLGIIKTTGLPVGVACHELEVVQFCEKEKFPLDFYVKTLHHLKYPTAPKPDAIQKPYAEVPGYWCNNPEETAEFMKGVTKPWIAFKVLAAGAIPPRDGFNYAFARGGDFILAGMFDFQTAEDAQIIRDAFAANKNRARPWRG